MIVNTLRDCFEITVDDRNEEHTIHEILNEYYNLDQDFYGDRYIIKPINNHYDELFSCLYEMSLYADQII